MSTKNFGIFFGVLSDSLAKQIKAQGFKFDKAEVKNFEQQREAIFTLRIGRILSDSILDKAETKLYNKIRAHVCKVNNLKAGPALK